MFFPAMPWTRAQRKRDEFSYQVPGCTCILYGHVLIHIIFILLLLGNKKLTCSTSNHTGIHSPQRNPETRLCHLHTQCIKTTSHTCTIVPLPPHQEQYSTSIFMTNPSLECLKQLENRESPTPFPPPRQKTNKKNSCFCQASTEYTAFHFIKTIIQKPAKNYIKLPPCTTPSPFLQPLLPSKEPPNPARTGPHQGDTALNASYPTGSPSPHTEFSRPKQHYQEAAANPESPVGLRVSHHHSHTMVICFK